MYSVDHNDNFDHMDCTEPDLKYHDEISILSWGSI